MVTNTIYVTKRSGEREPLNLDKIHTVVQEACKGISGVSESQIEFNANLAFVNGITTKDIQNTLIKSAADLIKDETNYQYVAGRLVNYILRKEVFGSMRIPPLFEHVSKHVASGYYDADLIAKYTQKEFQQMDKFVWHDRDYDLVYCAMEQFRSKYLVKNRVSGEIYETPQLAYILIAASIFIDYPKATRLKYVREFYDAISTHFISLPTPIMAGIRTPEKQFSSCVLIDCDDNLPSIIATSGAIITYVSQKAGIGINGGALRAGHSPVAGGRKFSTGAVPFWKMFASSVKSCNQGGVRGGSATLFYPIWHLDVDEFLVLKNNKGTENNRERRLDYGVQLNKLFYERYIQDGNITLFSPSDTPGLYDAFFANYDEFVRLYTLYETQNIRKIVVKARDLFTTLVLERKNTGRVYIQNVDHCNDHSSVYEPIKMSNLCLEITLPTTPLTSLEDPVPGVALCTLSAINWGKIKAPVDFEKYCNLAVRALNAILDIQDYPLPAARNHTKKYRPLGVGIINFAYFLAKNDVKWGTPEALKLVHEFTEAWSYYLIKASADLAIERGALSQKTKYSEGILPIDTYKKSVDSIANVEYKMNWDDLRKQLRETGICNSTLMALMPAETSALISNATNGVEPPRALVSQKASKDGGSDQVVPEYKKLKNKYELLWDFETTQPIIDTMAVLQKFIDQAISTNQSYNPDHFPDREIPMSVLIGDLLYAYKMGLKTLYYSNMNDGQEEFDSTLAEAEESTDEICDACAI